MLLVLRVLRALAAQDGAVDGEQHGELHQAEAVEQDRAQLLN